MRVVVLVMAFLGACELGHFRNAWATGHGKSVTDAYAQGDPLDKYRAGQAMKVVVIGNSVAVGYVGTGWATIQEDANDRIAAASRLDTGIRSWPIQMMEGLQSVNANVEMVNLSGNGWSTNDHLGYNFATNGRDDTIDLVAAMNPRPDMVLLPLQINDRNGGLGTAVMRTNTETIIRELRALDVVPVIVTEFAYIGGFEDYNAEIIAVANDNNVAAIHTYQRMQTAWQADLDVVTGIMADYAHPNPSGHDLLASIVLEWFNTPMMRARP